MANTLMNRRESKSSPKALVGKRSGKHFDSSVRIDFLLYQAPFERLLRQDTGCSKHGFPFGRIHTAHREPQQMTMSIPV